MQTKALLLAGGLGTRLRPLTESVPKCLVPVAGKVMLDYWYDALEKAEVNEVLVNNHYLPNQVRDHIKATNAVRELDVFEAYEPKLLGSAGTLHANRDWANGASEVIVIYADNLSDVDLSAVLDFHRGHTDLVTMVLFRCANPMQCGIVTLEGDRITDFVEKPKNPVSNLANAGLYIIDADAWMEIADMRAFDLAHDVIPAFIGRMRGFEHKGYHRDIGTLESLEQANADAKRLFQ